MEVISATTHVPQMAKIAEPAHISADSAERGREPADVYSSLEGLCHQAQEENFQDGFDSAFSSALIKAIKLHGDAAVEALAHLIVYERISPSVASEALRWLGKMENPRTYEYRLWLLQRSLFCTSPIVRDGAALGLASLGDVRGITALKNAIERERLRELCNDMTVTLRSLQAIR